MYILPWKKGMWKFWHFHFTCEDSYKHWDISSFQTCQIWGKIWPVSFWKHLSEGFSLAVEAAAAHCVWEAASRLIRRGERSSNKKLRREDYKYCMAAAILLPEPSYCCYIAHCKNVRSLHCTALNHVEITNRTVRLSFGWELQFGVF